MEQKDYANEPQLNQASLPRQSSKYSPANSVTSPDEKDVPVVSTESRSGGTTSSNGIGDEPTEEERLLLRKVADKLPWSTFIIAAVEFCERFCFYGFQPLFQNYIQRPRGIPGKPGALGRGQSVATSLSNFFSLFCYVTPLLGSVVADQYLGRYNTIVYFAIVYLVGLVILLVTSLPVSLEHGAGFGGIVIAMIIIGTGTGGIKSNVAPLIAEQYRETRQRIQVLKSGERVILDPTVTIQRIYHVFYLCINIGSLSAIATTEMELHIGFWSAYTLALCMFVVGFVVLLVGKRFYVVRPPRGSIIPHAFKAMWLGATNRFNMDAAKPSYRGRFSGASNTLPWNDDFIDELKRALVACRIFLFYPIYWVVYNQISNNLVSQAGQMQAHGAPNDLLQNIDPITLIIFIPICDRLLYPFLRKIGIPFQPVTRMTVGFLLAALAMVYAAIVQHLIYSSPPCYDQPSACPDDTISNHIHIAIQIPAYVFIGLSEIFASITSLEYAYTKAPPNMKSFVQALSLLPVGVAAAIGIGLGKVAKDPDVLWEYTSLAVAALVAGVVFWILFRRYNKTEDSMNAIEAKGEKPIEATAISATGKDLEGHL